MARLCAVALVMVFATSCTQAGAPSPAPQAAAPTAQAASSPSATACPAESAQFDFWVGDWDLAVTDRLGTGTATEHVTKENCVVSERYSGYFNGKAKYEATSTNSWDAGLRAWKQRYVDPSGTYWYTGTFADGTMTMYAGTEGGARANTNRVRWTNIGQDGLDWIWERTLDGGTTWSIELSRIRYTRKR